MEAPASAAEAPAAAEEEEAAAAEAPAAAEEEEEEEDVKKEDVEVEVEEVAVEAGEDDVVAEDRVDLTARVGSRVGEGPLSEPPATDSLLPDPRLVIRDLDTGQVFLVGEKEPEFALNTFQGVGGDPNAPLRMVEQGDDADFEEEEVDEDEEAEDSDFFARLWNSLMDTVLAFFGWDTDSFSPGSARSEGGEGRGLAGIERPTLISAHRETVTGVPEDDGPPAVGEGVAKEHNGGEGAGDADGGTGDSAQQQPRQEQQGKPSLGLEDFRLLKQLGQGAFGRVILVQHRRTELLYALKVVRKVQMSKGEKQQARAERDVLAAMTHQAPHPFTTGLKFAFQSSKRLYLGMRFLPGGDMKALLRQFKRFPVSWARFFAAELAMALSHLHSLNVLYRDIKPHNVMLDEDGHITLVDYGLAKQHVRHPRGAKTLVGTPDYSAPEVLQTGVARIEAAMPRQPGARNQPSTPNGKIGYGKAADWWSLGVMVYEMIAGYPAFRGSTLRDTYRNVLTCSYRFPTREDLLERDIRERERAERAERKRRESDPQPPKRNFQVPQAVPSAAGADDTGAATAEGAGAGPDAKQEQQQPQQQKQHATETGEGAAADTAAPTTPDAAQKTRKSKDRSDGRKRTSSKHKYRMHRCSDHPGEECGFTDEACDFIRSLLQPDPALRLGAWGNPPQDVMTCPFFAGIDWRGVLGRQLRPPWRPHLEPSIRQILQRQSAARRFASAVAANTTDDGMGVGGASRTGGQAQAGGYGADGAGAARRRITSADRGSEDTTSTAGKGKSGSSNAVPGVGSSGVYDQDGESVRGQDQEGHMQDWTYVGTNLLTQVSKQVGDDGSV